MNTKVKLILIGVVICMTTLSFTGYKVATGLIDEQIAKSNQNLETKQVIAVPIDKSDTNLVINMMHDMSNSLIISDILQDEIEMNKFSINRLITLVDNMEASIEKPIVVQIARRWQEGDFISVDIDHNTICDLLGEEAGVATGRNRNAIRKAIENLK